MPSGNGVEVLVGVFVGSIHDLLKVCFPCYASAIVENLEMMIEGGIQDGEILVNPCERFVSSGNIERCAARFMRPCRVDGRLVGGRDSQMALEGLEDTDSGIVVLLGPSQVWLGSVLPRKYGGACGVGYSPIGQRIGQMERERRGEMFTRIVLRPLFR